jgi:hypothetical protein
MALMAKAVAADGVLAGAPMGVRLGRLGRPRKARTGFEKADICAFLEEGERLAGAYVIVRTGKPVSCAFTASVDYFVFINITVCAATTPIWRVAAAENPGPSGRLIAFFGSCASLAILAPSRSMMRRTRADLRLRVVQRDAGRATRARRYRTQVRFMAIHQFQRACERLRVREGSSTNSSGGVRLAAIAGHGIAMLADLVVFDDGRDG